MNIKESILKILFAYEVGTTCYSIHSCNSERKVKFYKLKFFVGIAKTGEKIEFRDLYQSCFSSEIHNGQSGKVSSI